MGLRGIHPATRAAWSWAPALRAVVQTGPEGLAVRAAVQNWLPGGSPMTEEPGATGAPQPSADERAQGQDVLGLGERERDALLAWVGENLTLVRRSAYGQRILYWSLGIGFVVGLAAHVGGFLLKSSTTTEPLLLMADLLYALGWALWTGVVLVVFVEIYPEAKKRQFKRALDAYEAAVGDQARAGRRRLHLPGPDGACAPRVEEGLFDRVGGEGSGGGVGGRGFGGAAEAA
jgi:hypothetical protein